MSGVLQMGFFGKLPGRGDFLRVGLSRAVAQAWDCWMQSVMPAVRDVLEIDGADTWLGLRAWRFAFVPGICGPVPITGLWLPSVDKVGRLFPLLIAAETQAVSTRCLDDAERLGREAISGRIEPEALAGQLREACCGGVVAPQAVPSVRWWRQVGADAVTELVDEVLPTSGTFLRMLEL